MRTVLLLILLLFHIVPLQFYLVSSLGIELMNFILYVSGALIIAK
jgi:hypothetical protein